MIQAWSEQLRESIAGARADPLIPMRSRVVAVYAFVAGWIAIWWIFRPEMEPQHHFFGEGGPIDWVSTVFLATAGFLAWFAWSSGPRRAEFASWFWLVAAVGFLFLSIDERFQFHEHILSDWQQPIFGDVPFGLRNWNDLVVIVYGLIAGAIFLAGLPAVLRYRGVRRLLVGAFLFYAAHTFLDAADEWFVAASPKEAAEETFKLLSGATLMLAMLQAALCRAARGAEGRSAAEPVRSPALDWRHTTVLFALTIVAGFVLTVDSEVWDYELTRRWGNPVIWLISVYLASAALFVWFSNLPARSRPAGTTLFAYLTTGLLMVVALDQLTVASAYRFGGLLGRKTMPEFISDRTGLLQNPRAALAVCALAAALLLWLDRRGAIAPPRLTVFYLFGVVLIAAGYPLIFAGAIRIGPTFVLLGAASLLLGSAARFATFTLNDPRA